MTDSCPSAFAALTRSSEDCAMADPAEAATRASVESETRNPEAVFIIYPNA